MAGKSLINDYTSGPVARQLLGFAWPFMVSNLLQTAYNLVDMMVVGQFVGAAGLSAVSVGADLMHFYTFIGLGFCNAGQVIISQYVGLGDRKGLSKIVGTMFTFVLGLSLLVSAVGLGGVDAIMGWLNVPAEALAYCRAYTVCCTAGLFFSFGYVMVAAILRGMGDAKRPLIFVAVASALNVALDLLLVSHGMGTFGAALATVIAQGVSFIFSIVYLWRRRESLGFELRLRDLIPDRRNLGLLLRLGIPMMIQTCAISISNLFVSSRINAYGVTVSAVTGVRSKLSSIASIVTLALSQAGATMVGQNFAARKPERVQRTLVTAILLGGAFAAALSAVIALWPEQVFALFNDDAEVLAMSHAYVAIAVLNFFGWACRGPSTALCNGMGFPAMNFTLGLVDGVVMRIGLCLLLGEVFRMGIQGYWLGSALAGYAFFIVMFPYFLSGKWKKREPPVVE
ncbi:MAG: MATE family efflux transporter [Oscillospiraceae bacterium]|nr:MATE family efflux transporter [Oscillospiraceae bacterium]